MAAKALGFKTIKGIDPHGFFVSFAKDKYDGALFEHTPLPDYAARGEQAEVILSIEGFCEQTDPDAYAAALSAVLAPGGIIYMQEPDGNSFFLPRNFPRWTFADPPLNFSYLSFAGIKALLGRHGLIVKKRLFTWSPFMRLIVTRK